MSEDMQINFREQLVSPELDILIGSGMNFKSIFSTISGGVESNTGVARLNQSLNDILSTRIGERGFMRSYGSNLYKLVFSPNDNILYDIIRVYVQDAIRKWEKRINLIKVSIISTPEDIDNHIINIRMEYIIRNSNIVGSYVFPFVREPMQIGGGGINE